MCATCGCGTETAHEHEHHHGHGDHHHDHHHHDHDHDHGPRVVSLEAQVLAKNDALAAQNRAWLDAQAIAAFNLMSSPGAGKTTLLERTLRDRAPTRPIAVIEGDQETTRDAERIRAAGARAVQVNTGAGCHLDAAMVARALTDLAPGPRSIVVIENVGNRVCPALFDHGERARVDIAS
ncbi:MAG TPA: hydrogenase nickel incorporation protein HypB, partial [Polyangia bacterium]